MLQLKLLHLKLLQLKSVHFINLFVFLLYYLYSVHGVCSSSRWWLPSSSQCLMHLKILPNYCPLSFLVNQSQCTQILFHNISGNWLGSVCEETTTKKWVNICALGTRYHSDFLFLKQLKYLYKLRFIVSLSCKKQCKIFIISNSVGPIKHQRET